MSFKNIKKTNPSCSLKVNVQSDNSLPVIDVKFSKYLWVDFGTKCNFELLLGDGHEAIFKTSNLTTLEVLQHFNKLCKEREKTKN